MVARETEEKVRRYLGEFFMSLLILDFESDMGEESVCPDDPLLVRPTVVGPVAQGVVVLVVVRWHVDALAEGRLDDELLMVVGALMNGPGGGVPIKDITARDVAAVTSALVDQVDEAVALDAAQEELVFASMLGNLEALVDSIVQVAHSDLVGVGAVHDETHALVGLVLADDVVRLVVFEVRDNGGLYVHLLVLLALLDRVLDCPDDPLLVGSAVVLPVTERVVVLVVVGRHINAFAKRRLDDVVMVALGISVDRPESGVSIERVASVNVPTIIT